MEITATEFKMNFGHYLEQSNKEEIWIKKNGKTIARVVGPRVSSVDAITGILKETASEPIDRHSIREERLSKYEVRD